MLNESIVDIEHTGYDEQVFVTSEGKSILPEVRSFVLNQAAMFSRYGRIDKVYIIGSILTKRWSRDTDIDVTIVMKPYSEASFSEARGLSIENTDTIILPNTKHPVNLYVRDDETFDRWDSIYDVLNNKWIAQQEPKPLNSDEYLKLFDSFIAKVDLMKGELERDLLDYNELKQYGAHEVEDLYSKVKAKTLEIDTDVKKLVLSYKVLHSLRKMSFEQPMSPSELKNYKSKNLLPANIVYKLLEKYHYLQLLQSLSKIMKTANNTIKTDKEVKSVGVALTNSSALESIINELTGSGAAGAYDGVPWGRKKNRQKKTKPNTDILTY